MFDPKQFLDMQVDQANDTKSTPVPVGEYVAVIEKVDVRQWSKKDDPSKSGLALDVLWNIDDANVKALLDREKVTSKQGIMLDLTDAGTLDMGKGKNITLGKLRDALGLNVPGQPFAFSMLPGRAAKVKIKHRVDGDNIYSEVEGVAKI